VQDNVAQTRPPRPARWHGREKGVEWPGERPAGQPGSRISEEVFELVKICPIRTGYTLVSPAVPDRASRRSKLAYTGLFQKRSGRIRVPVKCFLAEANGRRILVDTGWGRESASRPMKSIGFGLWFASEPVLPKEETLDAWFGRLGVTAEELDAVILTHMDVDHVGGLGDVRGARHFYAAREEWEAAQAGGVRYNRKLWKGIPIEPLAMREDAAAPFGRSCDLFGDGSVKVVFAPGHSAGSCAVVVSDGGKFAVLSGDNGYNAKSWDELALPGPMVSRSDMLRSLRWVKSLREDPRCAGVFAAHDPAAGMEPVAF